MTPITFTKTASGILLAAPLLLSMFPSNAMHAAAAITGIWAVLLTPFHLMAWNNKITKW